MNVQDFSGKTLGQYEIRERLGQGGMGAVYRGYQPSLRREVAVKILTLASEPQLIQRFEREAQTAASLEHPHIVPVYDYGTQDGISYIIMRLLTGGSLSERINNAKEKHRALPSLTETADVLRNLASALEYAHSRGVVHRDIKANNVMFDDRGTPFLVDFGIVKLTGATSELTGAGMTVGTPAYMAPEQWRGESVTPAVDQYALGVLTYVMLTGQMPFEAPTPYELMYKHLHESPTSPMEFRQDIPEGLKDVLDQAMAKTPEERYETLMDFVTAFDNAMDTSTYKPTGFFVTPLPQKPPVEPLTTDSAQLSGHVTITPAPGAVPSQSADAPTSQRLYEGSTTPPGQPIQLVQPTSQTPAQVKPKSNPLMLFLMGAVVIGILVIGVMLATGSNVDTDATSTAQALALIPTNTDTPEPTNTPATPAVIPNRNMSVRSGPGTNYQIILNIEADDQLDILGVSEDGAWYQVLLPDGSSGWLVSSGSMVDTMGNVAALPTALAPTETLTYTPTNTATDTATPTPSNTPTDTPTATPATPIMQPNRDTTVRGGPGSRFPVVGTLEASETLDILGISEDGAWYQVLLPDGSTGWVVSAASVVRTAGDVESLAVAEAPTNTPTKTPTATVTPTNTATFTPSATATATHTPTPATPVLEPKRDTAVLVGPGSGYPVLATLTTEDRVDIIGISEDGAWYQIELSNGDIGWLSASPALASAYGNLDSIEVAAAPTNTPTNTALPSKTPTNTPTNTVTPSTPIVVPNREITVREGPGSGFAVITNVSADAPLDILAVSDDGLWYQVLLPDGSMGWLIASGSFVDAFGDLDTLPTALPPTNTPTHTPTPKPSNTPVPTPSPTNTLTLTPSATATPESCPNTLPSRIRPGMYGRVLANDDRPLNVRSGPGLTFPRIGQLAIFSTFEVLGGPECANSLAWFRIVYSQGLEGWIAEADDFYFVEPIDEDVFNDPSQGIADTPILEPVCPSLIAIDDFDNLQAANDWFQGGSSDTTVAIVDGNYQVRIVAGDVDDARTSWGSLRGIDEGSNPVRVEAVMRAEQFTSDDTFLGLWLNYQDDTNFMSFAIRGDGAYRIGRYQSGYTWLVNWKNSGYIRTGDNVTNTLRVDYGDGTYTLYINGQLIDSVNDTTWNNGRIAFFGSTYVMPMNFYMDYFRLCGLTD